jgi:hypothetical protein
MQNRYEENKARYTAAFPVQFRILAQIISVLFHPLLMLTYAYILLAWSNCYLFGETSFEKVFANKANGLLFIWLLIFSFFVPLLSVVMMKALGLISDIEMSEKTDRTGPYIIVGLLYIVIFMNFNNNSSIPAELSLFALGSTIALFTAFIINIFSKISMHTVGMGGFVAMVIIILAQSQTGNEYLLVFAILTAGLVGSSRLLLSAHEPVEIYGGYFIGFLSQFVAMNYLFR